MQVTQMLLHVLAVKCPAAADDEPADLTGASADLVELVVPHDPPHQGQYEF